MPEGVGEGQRLLLTYIGKFGLLYNISTSLQQIFSNLRNDKKIRYDKLFAVLMKNTEYCNFVTLAV